MRNLKKSISMDLERLIGNSVPRGYTKDEGRSLGVGLQEQASNHLKLLW